MDKATKLVKGKVRDNHLGQGQGQGQSNQGGQVGGTGEGGGHTDNVYVPPLREFDEAGVDVELPCRMYCRSSQLWWLAQRSTHRF